jgi:hypothetical protein
VIHQSVLPQDIRRLLTEIVFLQLGALRWAAAARDITKEGYRDWIAGRGRGGENADAIADWMWSSSARVDQINVFATGPRDAKRVWSKRLINDASCLLREHTGNLHTFDPQNAPDWQQCGAAFLRDFYKVFRTGSFPGSLFRGSAPTSFGAQDYFRAFVEHNRRLDVCPGCDENVLWTIIRGEIRAEIDHYFPRRSYPHLSCHPFNLVPLCHACNAWAKHTTDVLAPPVGYRWRLEQIWLPYRGDGLAPRTVVDVETVVGDGTFKFPQLRARAGVDVQQSLLALARLYDVPSRWSECSARIGEKLFRRLRSQLGPAPDRCAVDLDRATECFDDLLVTMYVHDLGRDPWTLPAVWLLRHLLDTELTSPGSALAQELGFWNDLRAAV